ncbi:FkbM family methyltransferase [Muricoccus roseus]|uniref:FkbM family methyltransferase n=1 Tax=Muricoccus roseus TaxID=198092 RepID=UPI00240797CC|nr:FkbM family methyltransferase [Roseomonas rosea]
MGAHDPFVLSNTALLNIESGWRGINVDLDSRYVDRLREARPDDISVCCAIGAADGEIEAVIFEEGAFNTIDADRQARFTATKSSGERRIVPVRTIPSLLDEYLPAGQEIGFLNLDVEGVDFAALNANDWKQYRPKVIAVETHAFDLHNPKGNDVFNLLVSQGYRLRAQMLVTSIFSL